MSTGRCSELRAENEVRYTGVERFLFITMSKTSGVAEGFYGLVVGIPVQSSDRISRNYIPVGFSFVGC